MVLSECHREVRKQRAKPVLGCVMAIWELSISRCPYLSPCTGNRGRGRRGKKTRNRRCRQQGPPGVSEELALTYKLWASGTQSSVLSNPVQSRPVPSNQPALAVEALQVGQEPGTARGGGQTAALESGRAHSDSRVAPGSACGGCMLVCLFCLRWRSSSAAPCWC